MCRFNPPHHYRVDLLDITGVNLYQMMFNQDDCSDDLCSAVFPLHSTSQSHHVKIGIGNSFGSSMSEISEYKEHARKMNADVHTYLYVLSMSQRVIDLR